MTNLTPEKRAELRRRAKAKEDFGPSVVLSLLDALDAAEALPPSLQDAERTVVQAADALTFKLTSELLGDDDTGDELGNLNQAVFAWRAERAKAGQ